MGTAGNRRYARICGGRYDVVDCRWGGATDGQAKGGAIPEDFYVQVRYPHDTEWVAVDVAEDRPTACRLAGEAFRHRANAAGELPSQVRVASAPDLLAEGGQDALNRAAAALWVRADPP